MAKINEWGGPRDPKDPGGYYYLKHPNNTEEICGQAQINALGGDKTALEYLIKNCKIDDIKGTLEMFNRGKNDNSNIELSEEQEEVKKAIEEYLESKKEGGKRRTKRRHTKKRKHTKRRHTKKSRHTRRR